MKLLAVTLVSIFVVSRTNGACPSGYDEFIGHCYMVLPMDMYGQSASHACDNVGRGGKRASIHDAFTNKMVANMGKEMRPGSCLWIGLEYNKMDETFAWDDGQPIGNGYGYNNWARGYPQQPLPAFPLVYMSTKRESSGTWMNDYIAQCGVVCEIPNESPPPFSDRTEGPNHDFTLPPVRPSVGPDFTLPPVRPSVGPDFTLPPVRPSVGPVFTLPPVRPSVGPDFTLQPVRPSAGPDFTLPPVRPSVGPVFTLPPARPSVGPNHDYTLPPAGPSDGPNHDFTLPHYRPFIRNNHDYTLLPPRPSDGPNQDVTLPHDRPSVRPDFTWPPFNNPTEEPHQYITAQPSYAPHTGNDFTVAPSAGPQCPPQDYEGRGMIFSPDFPAPYPNGITCTYVIHASSGSSQILILFDEINIEEHTDLIFVYDGPVSDEPKVISGHRKTGEEKFLSTSNLMTIVFSTDKANSAAGWSAKFLSVN